MTTAAGTILITGASGHLGRAVAREAARAGMPTVLWNRRPDSALGSGDQVHADLTDPHAAHTVLSSAPVTTVIHLAAITGARCEQDTTAAHDVNVAATVRLASEAAQAGVTRFIFASSAAVYGDAFPRPIVETDFLAGKGTYAATKIAAEHELSLIAEGSDMEVVLLRIFNVFGPGLVDSLIHRLLQASAQSPVTLHGGDDFVRDYIHVDDVAVAALAAGKRPMPTAVTAINVASGIATSNAALFSTMSDARREHVRLEPGRASHSQADVSRLKKVLAVAAQGSLPRL